MELPNRRPCINTPTDNLHFSVSYHHDTGLPIEFFITGRGKVGQQFHEELYGLSVKTSKLIQGEFDEDFPKLLKKFANALRDFFIDLYFNAFHYLSRLIDNKIV
jgi:hypothetical protein